MNYVDVNGDSIWISVEINNSIERYYYGKDADGNYGFIGSNGKLYLGDDSFANSLSTALGQLINGGDVGTDLVTYLMNSTNNLDIVPNIKNSADFDNAGYIYWNPNNNKEGGLNKFGNNERPAFIGLAHEMAHIRDSWKGTIDKRIWMSAAELGTEKNVYNAEKYATDIENRIRAENGITLREYYSSTAFPQLRLINNKGRNNFYNHLYYNTIKIGTENFRFIWNH